MFVIRTASLEDAPIIVQQRRAMFSDMGYRDNRILDEMSEAFLPWLERKMAAGEYLGWLAMDGEGVVTAGCGLWLMDWPPHMVGPGSNRRGNILNVYTRPDCRRQGLGRRLTEMAIAWCRVNGIQTIILHASDEGRRLYESLGFQATNEMRMIV